MAILRKKPGHVPDWVWDEYLQAKRIGALPLFEVPKVARPDLTDAERDLPSRIVADAECARVWKAIEKRKSRMDGRMPLHGEHGTAHAQALFMHVRRYFIGPQGLEVVPGATRASLGKRIESQVAALQSTLAKVHGLGGVPDEIAEQLNLAVHLASTGRLPRRNLASDITNTFFSEDGTVNALAALARGAKAWAITKPQRYRVADGPHVYFVKSMNGYFEHCYGAPLHEQVAVLTNCLFGTALTKGDILNNVNRR